MVIKESKEFSSVIEFLSHLEIIQCERNCIKKTHFYSTWMLKTDTHMMVSLG